jgi:hypothetical protein
MNEFSNDTIALMVLIPLLIYVSVIKLYIKFNWFRKFMDWLLTKR